MRRLMPYCCLSMALVAACEPTPSRRRVTAVPDTTPADVPTGPVAPIPDALLSATSTIAAFPESAGLPRLHIVNSRYLVYRGFGDQRAMLEETTDRFCCRGGERDDSATITVRRRATPADPAPQWSATVQADEGDFWREFYRAALRGWGDRTDAVHFVHMMTGHVAFTHSRERGEGGDRLPSVHHWASATTRYAAFHDRNTAADPAEARRDSLLIGVLQYGPPAGPVQRVLVRRARGRAAGAALQRLEFGQGEWRGRDLEVPAGVAARSASESMSGFSVRVVVGSPGADSAWVVEIPVVRDRLRPDQATLPPGFSARVAS